MDYKYQNINDYNKHQYYIYYNSLPQKDKDKINLIIKGRNKKQLILTRVILKEMLINKYNLNYNEMIFKYNKYGKPCINSNIHFNISHSHDYVIVAISDNKIGVDIEKIRTVNLNIAKQFATDEEYQYIINSKNNFIAFWSIYVLKEAYFKMLGTNLSNMKKISFIINDNDVYCSDENIIIKLSYEIDNYVYAIIYKERRKN